MKNWKRGGPQNSPFPSPSEVAVVDPVEAPVKHAAETPVRIYECNNCGKRYKDFELYKKHRAINITSSCLLAVNL